MIEKKVDKIQLLLDHSIRMIRISTVVFAKYSKVIEWIGMSRLLQSIIDIEKEHEKKLLRIYQSGKIEELFDLIPEIPFSAGDFFKNVEYTDKMDYSDFLSMVILQLNESCRLYGYFTSISRGDTLRHFFNTLSAESKKQKMWVLDRYELEILTM